MIRLRFLEVSLAGAGTLLGASSSAANGVWIDIGADVGSYVYESSGGPSWEYFPPYPFGQSWPAGTLVYTELSESPCEFLPLGCDPTTFVAGYIARFDGTSCGCGGLLAGTCTLRLYYNPIVVYGVGASESQLVLARWYTDEGPPRWVAVDGATVDTDANFVEASVAGSVGTSRYYALFRSLPELPGVQESTWSRVKLLWR